ncbi:hypothetical protein B296_00025436 [Ensete ventricosum]|uniref:non-specific serine/threonine protein kinase n=1 Tax=Ensete ventricosum TaxID=4639 RepID=A0A426ZI74_ENSVE|nr:hypothetical protein B296_00025436 [Ensete ventricosum]
MLGIIYRDLKPENVLVREDGHIMLSDFDLSLRCTVSPTLIKSSNPDSDSFRRNNPAYCVQPACVEPSCIQPSCVAPTTCFSPRLFSSKSKERKQKLEIGNQISPLPELIAEPTDARSMSFVGTHEYLAPEIIKGEGHGSAVDWWTFGIFLYELLFGKTPFKGSGNRATLFNVIGQPLRFPESPVVSFAARDLIRGLLVKEPQHRLAYKRGATEIKQHPFFEGVNWALIRCASPPEVPKHVSIEQFMGTVASTSQKANATSGKEIKRALCRYPLLHLTPKADAAFLLPHPLPSAVLARVTVAPSSFPAAVAARSKPLLCFFTAFSPSIVVALLQHHYHPSATEVPSPAAFSSCSHNHSSRCCCLISTCSYLLLHQSLLSSSPALCRYSPSTIFLSSSTGIVAIAASPHRCHPPLAAIATHRCLSLPSLLPPLPSPLSHYSRAFPVVAAVVAPSFTGRRPKLARRLSGVAEKLAKSWEGDTLKGSGSSLGTRQEIAERRPDDSPQECRRLPDWRDWYELVEMKSDRAIAGLVHCLVEAQDSSNIWLRCTTRALFGRGAQLGHYLAEVHNSGTIWPRCRTRALFGRGERLEQCLAEVHDSGTIGAGRSTNDQKNLDGRSPIRKACITSEGCLLGYDWL